MRPPITNTWLYWPHMRYASLPFFRRRKNEWFIELYNQLIWKLAEFHSRFCLATCQVCLVWSCKAAQSCVSVSSEHFQCNVTYLPATVCMLQGSSPLLWSLVLGLTQLAFSGVQTVAIGAPACFMTTWHTGISTWALLSFSRVSPSSSTPPRGTAYAGTTRSTSKVMRATWQQLSFTHLSLTAPNWSTRQNLYITWRTTRFVNILSPFYSLWTQRNIFLLLKG